MEQIPANIREAVENDEPISINGFTLFPIQMREYRQFEAAKFALLLRQGSLPVKYAVLPYLQALYAMDYDAVKETGQPMGFTAGLLTMLALSMRFPADALLKQAGMEYSDEEQRLVAAVRFRAGENILRLTPADFDRIRPVIAAQNGLELPDEAENADLVEADNDIAARGSVSVKADYRTLMASVARDQRCRVRDLMDYTIREFTDLKNAIEREKNYTLCKMAEYSGVTFKGGNPCPSWCYDAAEKGTSLISMSTFMAGPGSAAAMK